MTPQGGAFVGLPAIVSDAVETDSVMLIDAFGIAGDAEGIGIRVLKHASVEMDDDPTTQDATTGTGASLVSMWQTNSVALDASIYFGCERIRDNSAAILTGVQWGAEAESA